MIRGLIVDYIATYFDLLGDRLKTLDVLIHQETMDKLGKPFAAGKMSLVFFNQPRK